MKHINSHIPMPLIGAWKLTSFGIQKADNDVIYPFGEDAEGILIYTGSGLFSGQVMRRGRPVFASGDQMKGTSEEMEANFKGCISYYGHYEFNCEEGVVIHHVEHSLFPNWEKTSQKRFFELSDNRLKIRTPPMLWGGDGEIVAFLLFNRIT